MVVYEFLIYLWFFFLGELNIDHFNILVNINPAVFDQFAEPLLGDVCQFEFGVIEIERVPVLLEVFMENL
jgi:hypothetical protein